MITTTTYNGYDDYDNTMYMLKSITVLVLLIMIMSMMLIYWFH